MMSGEAVTWDDEANRGTQVAFEVRHFGGFDDGWPFRAFTLAQCNWRVSVMSGATTVRSHEAN